jgi:hypothetical protein
VLSSAEQGSINTREVAFTLVSIGSSIFNKAWLDEMLAALQGMVIPLLVFLDQPEAHNLQVFEGLDEVTAHEMAIKFGDTLVRDMGLNEFRYCQYWRWADVERQPQYTKYWETIGECYDSSGAFQRHCRNQVFSNLRPRLRAIGIERHSDKRITPLVPYLLKELAAKICFTQEGTFTAEILAHAEMNIMASIYEGKYRRIASLIKRRPTIRAISDKFSLADYSSLVD